MSEVERACAFQCLERLDIGILCLLKNSEYGIKDEVCYPEVCPLYALLGKPVTKPIILNKEKIPNIHPNPTGNYLTKSLFYAGGGLR